MKPQYLLIQTLWVLTFGLASCSSDNSSGPPDQTKDINVEIQNSDQTIQRIKQTKKIRVSSAILLSEEDQPQKIQKVSGTTLCRASWLQGELTGSFDIQSVDQIAVKDILPVRVFTPKTAPGTVLCDIEMEMTQQSGGDIRVSLDAVEILQVEEFHNFSIAELESREPIYSYAEDWNSRQWLWPTNEGMITTICDSELSQNFIQASQVDAPELFPEFVFTQKALQKCRLHLKAGLETWVSKSFWVQKSRPSITSQFALELPHRMNFDMHQDPVATWTLFNNGEVDTILKFKRDQTQLSLIPAYGGESSGFYQFQKFNIPGNWEISTRHKVEVVGGKKDVLIHLQPGEELVLSLNGYGTMKCLLGTHGGLNLNSASATCNPSQSILLQGFRIIMDGFPKLELSAFADTLSDQWRSLGLETEVITKVDNHFEFWLPNRDLQKHCPNLQGNTPEIGENFDTSSSLTPGFYKCDLQ